jgi:hypothetical protein
VLRSAIHSLTLRMASKPARTALMGTSGGRLYRSQTRETISSATSCLRAKPGKSRHLADFRCRLSRGTWPFSNCCSSFSRFGCDFNRSWQFQLELFRRAMVAMVHPLDARSFFFHPPLSVSMFPALVVKVFRNRFSCHGRSVAELSPPSCPILATRRYFMGRHEEGGGFGGGADRIT